MRQKNERPDYLKDVYVLPNSSREDAEKYVKELEERARKFYQAYLTIVKRQRSRKR